MSGPADKTAASSVGERLRAARDRQGHTLQKVSEDLHLDVPLIEAMEENRFRALGAPVYARGHLRKYAQLLGLDVDAVLAEYEAAHTGPVEPNLVPAPVDHQKVVPDRPANGRRWAIAGAIAGIAALGAGAAWWYLRAGHRAVESSPPVIAAERAPVAAEPSPVVPTVQVEPAPVTPGAGQPGPAPIAAAGATARLRLRFQANSWVEIYDATGARLLFDERVANSTRTVVGAPPFKILLGNYSGVEMTLDGRAIVVPERSRFGATARFRVMPGGTTLSSWGAE